MAPRDLKRIWIAAIVLIVSFVLGGFLFAGLVGAAVLFRLMTKKTNFVSEGEDLVVRVPICLCEPCRNLVDGDAKEHALVWVYQCLFLLGIILALVALLSERISLIWGVMLLVAAACLKLLVRYLEHRSPHGAKAFSSKVPEYAQLFNAFPKAQVWRELPPALRSAIVSDPKTLPDGRAAPEE